MARDDGDSPTPSSAEDAVVPFRQPRSTSKLPVPRIVSKLDQRLAHAGLTQTDLARAIGRDRPHICRLVNARHPNPTLETALMIAAELHCRVEDIWKLD